MYYAQLYNINSLYSNPNFQTNVVTIQILTVYSFQQTFIELIKNRKAKKDLDRAVFNFMLSQRYTNKG